ncbi:MAG: hypothetical protein HRT82_05735 [Henriciella sp.]|nr:hypothetical protein [Henriciella sp.]
MTPDDFELMAFVDGELDAQTSKRVAEAVEADPALRAKVDALIESRDVARAAYAPAEDAPLSPALKEMMDGLQADLDAPEPVRAWQGVSDGMGSGAGVLSRTRYRLAAMTSVGVALGAAAVWMLFQQAQPQSLLILSEAGELALSDRAQRILDETPSGHNAHEFSVQASFVSENGAACRQFEVTDKAGIACLDQQDWKLVVLTDLPDEGLYQAAGGTDVLAVATAELGVAKVLTKEEEAARIANDWQPRID